MSKHAPRGPMKAHRPIDAATHEAPIRCKARSSRTGEPCKRYPIQGATVCRTHGGAAPQVQRKARERLEALVPKAISRLDSLIDRDEFPTVQFQASKAVIEFAEGRAKERVEVTGKDGAALIPTMSNDQLRAELEAALAKL